MSSIKLGDRVEVINLQGCDIDYCINIGSTGVVNNVYPTYYPEGESVSVTWDHQDKYHDRKMYSSGKFNQLKVIDEPDYYIYPNTPVGTKVVFVRDSASKMGFTAYKGGVGVLEELPYKHGKYLYIRLDQNGVARYYNVEDLMILGFDIENGVQDFEI